MPTLSEIFNKMKITLYQNESLDLDHYYQEPYQDEDENIKDIDEPFETNKSKKKRKVSIDFENKSYSNFSFFMDGSRRTYKIGDTVLNGKEIFPVVVAQVRAGCTERTDSKKICSYNSIQKKNILLLSSRINDVDFTEICQRIKNSNFAQNLNLEVLQYKFERIKDNVPINAAIAKANSEMHNLEIEILEKMVHSQTLNPDKMLIVDGPLQFLKQDNGKKSFADLFYNVVGVSKSFDPMLPTSGKSKRGCAQIGTELLKLNYGERTPVFLKVNCKGRKFGCWYLRIRPQNRVSNPLQGIVKLEKMALSEDEEGIPSEVIDNISLSILNESNPTCYGRDERWPSHLYPVYLTETLIKSSFESDLVFINKFKRNF